MDAGLQSGDVIRSVAGQEVASAEQFREVLLQLTPKETYSVTVMQEDVYKRQVEDFDGVSGKFE